MIAESWSEGNWERLVKGVPTFSFKRMSEDLALIWCQLNLNAFIPKGEGINIPGDRNVN